MLQIKSISVSYTAIPESYFTIRIFIMGHAVKKHVLLRRFLILCPDQSLKKWILPSEVRSGLY